MIIFIIDDDQINLFLVENLLLKEDKTLDIRTFRYATDALEALKTDNVVPDIIFLDLNMPVMDGWEFLDLLTPLEAALKEVCSIYILTTSLGLKDVERASKYQIVERLITKPLIRLEIKPILSNPKFTT